MPCMCVYRTRMRLSHGRLRGGVREPTWQTLEEALEITAGERGGRVTSGEGERKFLLFARDFPPGIEVRVEADGSANCLYSRHDGDQRAAANLCEAIAQNHAALAVARALGEMGYAVEVDETVEPPDDLKTIAIGAEGVSVKVLPGGLIQTRFTGVGRDACPEQAARLADALACFGLSMNEMVAHAKPRAQSGDELDGEASKRHCVGHGNGRVAG